MGASASAAAAQGRGRERCCGFHLGGDAEKLLEEFRNVRVWRYWKIADPTRVTIESALCRAEGKPACDAQSNLTPSMRLAIQDGKEKAMVSPRGEHRTASELLTQDEAAAIYLYTTDKIFEGFNRSSYSVNNRKDTHRWSEYMYLFLCGLSKLPAFDEQRQIERDTRVLYRCLKHNVLESQASKYAPGSPVVFWAATSTSVDRESARIFLEGNSLGTELIIHVDGNCTGRILGSLSAFESEEEVLFAPGAKFIILRVEAPCDDCAHPVVHMRHVQSLDTDLGGPIFSREQWKCRADDVKVYYEDACRHLERKDSESMVYWLRACIDADKELPARTEAAILARRMLARALFLGDGVEKNVEQAAQEMMSIEDDEHDCSTAAVVEWVNARRMLEEMDVAAKRYGLQMGRCAKGEGTAVASFVDVEELYRSVVAAVHLGKEMHEIWHCCCELGERLQMMSEMLQTMSKPASSAQGDAEQDFSQHDTLVKGAQAWWRRAAALGSALAAIKCGRLAKQTQQCSDGAISWFNQAASLRSNGAEGDTALANEARLELARIYFQRNQVEEALCHLHMAEHTGKSAAALLEIGHCHRSGRGVERSKCLAIEYYRKAYLLAMAEIGQGAAGVEHSNGKTAEYYHKKTYRLAALEEERGQKQVREEAMAALILLGHGDVLTGKRATSS